MKGPVMSFKARSLCLEMDLSAGNSRVFEG